MREWNPGFNVVKKWEDGYCIWIVFVQGEAATASSSANALSW